MEFICRNNSAGHPADRRWNGRVYATGSMPGRMELEIHEKTAYWRQSQGVIGMAGTYSFLI